MDAEDNRPANNEDDPEVERVPASIEGAIFSIGRCMQKIEFLQEEIVKLRDDIETNHVSLGASLTLIRKENKVIYKKTKELDERLNSLHYMRGVVSDIREIRKNINVLTHTSKNNNNLLHRINEGGQPLPFDDSSSDDSDLEIPTIPNEGIGIDVEDLVPVEERKREKEIHAPDGDRSPRAYVKRKAKSQKNDQVFGIDDSEDIFDSPGAKKKIAGTPVSTTAKKQKTSLQEGTSAAKKSPPSSLTKRKL